MSKKDDLKTFRGHRVYSALPAYRNILRIYCWSEEKKRYEPPTRGKLYQANRYELVDGKKKRVSQFFETLEQAKNWQSGIDDERQQPVVIQPVPALQTEVSGGPTLKEVIEFWRKTEEKLLQGTRIYYNKLVDMLEPIHHKAVDNIKATDLDALIELWHKGYVSPNRLSFDRELETLNFFIRWYINNYDDAKAVYPVKDRHWKRSQLNKVKPFRRPYMLQEELDAFLQAVSELSGSMWLAFATVQVKQFMRVSETAAMKWSNFYPRNKEYLLCEHVTWPRVDGAPAVVAPGTKNREAQESFMLPLFQDSIDAITSQQKYPGCDLIFHDNGQVLTYRQIQYVFDCAFKKAGLPFRGTHVLRHTGATLFQSMSDGDRLALQFLGGWKTSRQPEHYAKIISTVGRKAIDKIEKRGQLVLLKTE